MKDKTILVKIVCKDGGVVKECQTVKSATS